MEYKLLKSRKECLFKEIMTDKYMGRKTSQHIVKEYRFLQREERRLAKKYQQAI